MFTYKVLGEKLDYDGTQLKSHFALSQYGIYGNSGIAFIGEARVKEHMVDLEDTLKEDFIYSPLMLNFILEFFPQDLEKAVLYQRLFLTEIYKLLVKEGYSHFSLRGDDLFLDDRKLSVSIATVSLVSSLIHTGLNIKTEGTPVKTVGLEELKIEPVSFAKVVLENFSREYHSFFKAISKVKGVE